VLNLLNFYVTYTLPTYHTDGHQGLRLYASQVGLQDSQSEISNNLVT